jgi:hypothetical protein
MRKYFRLSVPIVIISLLIIIGGATIGREHVPEEISVVEDSAFQGHMRRPRVAFRHDAHNAAAAFEYDACHHVYDKDGRLLENETSEHKECSECHAKKDDPRHLDLVAAYHKQCKGCHEEEKKGPVTCNECHVK